jgi:hypothetical protein
MPARSSTTKAPKAPKAPKPPKPWRREEGVYRSADDRFTIEGGGAGRWFVTDAESLDELGLARTIGPYDTLDDARAAADGQRAQATESSPLAERLAAAKTKAARERPAPEAPSRRRRSAGADGGDGADGADEDGADGGGDEGERTPARRPAAKPPARSWLEELDAEDANAAARARRALAALERLGIDDADGVVRRDVLGRQPAVAARLLGHSVATALRTRLEPDALRRDAGRAISGPMKALRDADEASLAAYAAFVTARVLETVLQVVSGDDRAEGAGRDLPGWRLVERPAARDGAEGTARRLIVTPADVAHD